MIAPIFSKLLVSRNPLCLIYCSHSRSSANRVSARQPSFPSRSQSADLIEDPTHAGVITNDVLRIVNRHLLDKPLGRLFAVIQMGSLQYKITTEDIVVIDGEQPFDVGDRIHIEKVLLVGDTHFTAIGRPVLPRDMVRIEATVIEKTLSDPQTHFTIIPRKAVRLVRFTRTPKNLIRINDIKILQAIPGVEENASLDDLTDNQLGVS